MPSPAVSGRCGTGNGLSGAWSLPGLRVGTGVRAGAGRRRVARGAVPGSGGLGEAIVIDRSQPGDHCQMTLERWLPISDEPRAEDAVNAISAILAASARTDPPRTTDTTTAP
jgi:hypothetical protein